MLQPPFKFGGCALNTYLAVVLTSSSHKLCFTEHDDLSQYHPNAVSSKVKSCYSYPASFADEHSISMVPIESSS